jgi:hypothetical protein
LWDIQRRGAFFLLRLPRALNLRTLRKLGPHDRLVRWTPKDSRGQWRKEGLPKSLDCRLLEYHRRGYRPLRLLSNVLDQEQLPWSAVSQLVTDQRTGLSWCEGLYHRRWQIEFSQAHYTPNDTLDRGVGPGYRVCTGVVATGAVVPPASADCPRRRPMSDTRDEPVPPRAA